MVVYSFGFSPFYVRVHLTPATRAEAIHDATHPSMPQSLTRVCAFKNMCTRWSGVAGVGSLKSAERATVVLLNESTGPHLAMRDADALRSNQQKQLAHCP